MVRSGATGPKVSVAAAEAAAAGPVGRAWPQRSSPSAVVRGARGPGGAAVFPFSRPPRAAAPEPVPSP